MAQPQDDRLSGDLPVAPSEFEDEERPSLSHDVVATYVADAVRSVEGVADLHSSPWKGLSPRVREMHAGGIVVRDGGPGVVAARQSGDFIRWRDYYDHLGRRSAPAVR